jgi:hypothetical protein
LLWLTRVLVFNQALLDLTSSIASHVEFALLVLLALDLIFLGVAEVVTRLMR